MKLFLAMLIVSSAVHAQVTKEKYYKVSEEIVGYSCPSGYYFNIPSHLCYPEKKEDSVNTSQASTESPSSEKHISTDKATVNIYNYANGKAVDMPAMDIEGKLGVKRRRSMDKKAVLSAVGKAIEGDWIEEEKINDGDLELED